MKKILIGFLVAGIVAAGLVLLHTRKARLASAQPAMILPATVVTTVLDSGPVTLTIPALAMVASDASTVLSTKITGRILSVMHREGDRVKAGDVLARIDASDLTAKKQGIHLQQQGIDFQIVAKQEEVRSLDTAWKHAVESHGRTEELVRIKGASIEQYRQEESEIARIQASRSAAQNSIASLKKSKETLESGIREIDSLLEYATVAAPIDGTISQVLGRPGDVATPGKALFRIASDSGLYLNLSLPDTLQPKSVILDHRILPLTSKNQAGPTGLAQYVAPIPPDFHRVEGQYVPVSIVCYQGETVLVPVDALLTVSGSTSVFLLDSGGKAERKMVQIQARGIEGVVISEDLSGRKLILAKPDILLRIAAGVPVAEIIG